jgi:hypothetical protein
MSVCPSVWNNATTTGQIFTKFSFLVLPLKCVDTAPILILVTIGQKYLALHMKTYVYVYIRVKVKQSHDRHWHALRTPKGRGSENFSAHGGDKVVSLPHRPSLPIGDITGIHFCLRLSRLQEQGAAGRIKSIRIAMTPSGMEPATFRHLYIHGCHNWNALGSLCCIQTA